MRIAFLLSACCTVSAIVSAQTPRPLQVDFKEHVLKNKLRVILAEDHSAPTLSIAVTYDVGSRNERQGRTGFAHLFEHMMFQGSENVGKGEHFILVFNNGGNMNGTTNQDRTNYFETVPSNQLDLVLFLEADRMKSLNINQGNLDNQRNAVQEERRLGVDNAPYGKTFEALNDTVFQNFAYKHSVIGSMSDLNAASVDDVTRFFRTYYAPNNAVLSLVGDFKSADALARIRQYFEPIEAQPAPPPVDTVEPEQTAEQRKSIDDAFAKLARVDIAFKTVNGDTPDWYALEVAARILGSGQSSRLYQRLVKEKQLAAQSGAFQQSSRGVSLFDIVAIVAPGKDPKDVEQVIYEELERLQKEAVSDVELKKVLTQARVQRVGQMEGTLSRAIQLSQNTVFYNDPGRINTIEEKYAHVTKDDIQRVAKKYFPPTKRTVITTTPKPAAPKQADR